MLCDCCLMLLYRRVKVDDKARKVFFALRLDQFSTLARLAEECSLSEHCVRDGLAALRGTGLVWSAGAPGLSASGWRLLEVLADADQQPARVVDALCDACLLKIGRQLPREAYDVLARLADGMVHSRHDLVLATELSAAQLRPILLLLEASGLIQSNSSRVFRLSVVGRRFEKLLGKGRK